jgi:hypothetical protein
MRIEMFYYVNGVDIMFLVLLGDISDIDDKTTVLLIFKPDQIDD